MSIEDFPINQPQEKTDLKEDKPQGFRHRTAARLAAVQALYQLEVTGVSSEQVIEEFQRFRFGQNLGEREAIAPNYALFQKIVKGASGLTADLDLMISSVLAETWPLHRLELVIKNILRAGSYELLYSEETDTPVIISEYVDIVHSFYDKKEAGFVNGILDKLSKKIRTSDNG
jgi:N utilization substance protein B